MLLLKCSGVFVLSALALTSCAKASFVDGVQVVKLSASALPNTWSLSSSQGKLTIKDGCLSAEFTNGQFATLVVPEGYMLKGGADNFEILDTRGKVIATSSGEFLSIPGAMFDGPHLENMLGTSLACQAPYFLVTPPDLNSIQSAARAS